MCVNFYNGVKDPGALGDLHRAGGPFGGESSKNQHQELHDETLHGN